MYWIKLTKQKPTEAGYYLTYNPTLQDPEPTQFVVDYWSTEYKMFTYADGVTDWAYLFGPIEEENIIIGKEALTKCDAGLAVNLGLGNKVLKPNWDDNDPDIEMIEYEDV
jgi:hypothetical protein